MHYWVCALVILGSIHGSSVADVRSENFRYVDCNSTCLRITGQSHDLLFKDFFITNASGYIVKDSYNGERYAGPAADMGAVENQEKEPR